MSAKTPWIVGACLAAPFAPYVALQYVNWLYGIAIGFGWGAANAGIVVALLVTVFPLICGGIILSIVLED